MKFKALLLFFMLSSFCVYSQEWQWANYVLGGGNHYAFDVEPAGDGNHVYAVGRYRALATFYGQDADVVNPTFAGSRDVFFAKIDSSGNYVFVNTEGGPGTDYALSVTTDEFGFVYIVGTTADSAYYENTGILSDAGGDVLIAKYDSNGGLVWVKNMAGDAFDYATAIESDKNGSLYISGYQTGNFDYDLGVHPDLGHFMMKMDYDGNVIWFDGPVNDNASSRTLISGFTLYEGNIYFAGRIRSSVTIDGIAVAGSGSWDDILFGKMDTSGTLIWVETAGGQFFDEAMDIEILNNEIYLVGSYAYNGTFDTVLVSSTLSTVGATTATQALNGADAFFAKYTIDGASCHWVKEVKSDNLDKTRSIHLDKNQNLVITGEYNAYDLYTPANTADLRIISYDSTGNVVWDLFPTGANAGLGYSISQDESGNYFFAGAFKGDYTFNNQVSVNGDVGKFSGLMNRIYPPIFEGDSVTACNADTVDVLIPDCIGSPWVYQWYLDGSLVGTDSSGFQFEMSGQNELICVLSSDVLTDTIHYPLQEGLDLDLGNDITTCDDTVTLVAVSSGNMFDWGSGPVLDDSTLLVNQSGTYIVEASMGACSAVDSILVTLLDCSGFDQSELDFRILYSSDYNYLKFFFNDHVQFMEIYNYAGQLIAVEIVNDVQKEFKTDQLSNGTYIIKANFSNDKSFAKKVIIY